MLPHLHRLLQNRRYKKFMKSTKAHLYVITKDNYVQALGWAAHPLLDFPLLV